eukprot:8716425-Pyramimonas_sp.AAC.1
MRAPESYCPVLFLHLMHARARQLVRRRRCFVSVISNIPIAPVHCRCLARVIVVVVLTVRLLFPIFCPGCARLSLFPGAELGLPVFDHSLPPRDGLFAL